ncbi:MAG: hypothetical protein U5J99_04200 [Parvularculaceae bacterium]|nr:hypothetical protein [Parvularculaceae bacterium]
MARTALPLSSFYAPALSKPAALYDNRSSRFGGLRCFSQGLGSVLVAYTGASATTAPGGAPMVTDFTSLDTVTLAMLDGRLTGPAQILAALALFLTAHHSAPRLFGVLAGAAIVYFHMQGVTLYDAFVFASDELRKLAGAFEAAHRSAKA